MLFKNITSAPIFFYIPIREDKRREALITNDFKYYYIKIYTFVNRDNVVLYRPKRLQNKFEDSFVVYNGEPAELKGFIKEN